MTSPESPSPSHPARGAGFALLGVAAVALVIGVISLFGGGDDNPPSANSTSQQPASTAPSTEPGTSAPETTTASPAIPTIVAPTTTTEPPVTQPPAGEPPVAKVPVRVYNNSTIAGLAARASDDVKRSGWEVAETGNYSQGQIPTTTVYYRPGTNEEASAKQLATALQARVEARFDGIQSANAGIIVIVTNDYRGAATGTK